MDMPQVHHLRITKPQCFFFLTETGVFMYYQKLPELQKGQAAGFYPSANVVITNMPFYASMGIGHCTMRTTNLPCENGYKAIQKKQKFAFHGGPELSVG
jgi:hypothetical protein